MMMAKRTVKSATDHPYIVIFERGLPCDHRMAPSNFRDGISDSSGVIVLTDRQTDTAENNTILAMLRCMGSNKPKSIRQKGFSAKHPLFVE